MVAYWRGSYRAQIPDGERKSGIPLSVVTPAPVNTTQGWLPPISAARRSTDKAVFYRPVPGTCLALELAPVPTDGFSHTTELRVRFAETDAQGIAHNAAYLV